MYSLNTTLAMCSWLIDEGQFKGNRFPSQYCLEMLFGMLKMCLKYLFVIVVLRLTLRVSVRVVL